MLSYYRNGLLFVLLIVFVRGVFLAQTQPSTANRDSTQTPGGAPQLSVQIGHSGRVTTVAFSPDNRLVVTGQGKTLCLWETGTGAEIRRIDMQKFVNDMRISRDSRFALIDVIDSNELWDLTTGQQVQLILNPSLDKPGEDDNEYIGEPQSFSPNGEFVLTMVQVPLNNTPTLFRLFDLGTGREARRFKHAPNVSAVAFSPDSRFILTGTENTARLVDVTTGLEVKRFMGHKTWINAVAFSPGGQFAITASGEFGSKKDNTARLWNVSSGKEVRQLKGHLASIVSVAFSPDRRLIATGSEDKTARLWEVETGREVKRFANHSTEVESVTFSPDSRFLITHSGSGGSHGQETARVWDVASGMEVESFVSKEKRVESLAFSSDSRFVLTGGEMSDDVLDSGETIARLWDANTRQVVRRFEGNSYWTYSGKFSPNGDLLLMRLGINTLDYIPFFWDLKTGQGVKLSDSALWTYPGENFAVSPDWRFALTSKGVDRKDRVARLFDIAAGREIRRFVGHENTINAVAFSPDGRFALTGSGDWLASDSKDISARSWDVATGQETQRFTGHSSPVNSVAFSPDGRFALTGSGSSYGGANKDSSARLWDIATGKELKRFVEDAPEWQIDLVRFWPDGRFVQTRSASTVPRALGKQRWRLWDVATGKDVNVETIAPGKPFEYTPHGRYVYSVSEDSTKRTVKVTISRWEGDREQELQQLEFEGRVSLFEPVGVAISPDGRFAVTTNRPTSIEAGAGDKVRLWDVTTGKERQLEEHSDLINSIEFSPDSRFLLTTTSDSIGHLWEVSTGRELCRLISFRDGTWMVVTPDGRFDTNDLEEIVGLRWVMPDDPLRALPLEIFMRDYYEPRLLPRLLAKDYLKPVRDLRSLNRTQPRVSNLQVSAPDEQGRVTVSFEATSQVNATQRNGDGAPLISEVHDARLFRNRQLVGYCDGQLVGSRALTDKAGCNGEVKTDASGKVIVTFNDIKLPRRADSKQVEFSAYAFNSDRVKSETTRKIYEPSPLPPTFKGRAYVITVGVNAYDDPTINPLRFAASDAERTRQSLAAELEKRGEYAEVVSVKLTSDYEVQLDGRVIPAREALLKQVRNGKLAVTEKLATKGNIKTIFDLLAGRPAPAEDVSRIPDAGKLRKAQPEDLIIIAFASHGYAAPDGIFYLIPADITQPAGFPANEKIQDYLDRCVKNQMDGQATAGCQPALEYLRRAISSDDLSLWLRDVDGGDLTLIVDACHSAASVGNEFKPGPMGSRGLGQLAYDKGVRLLAATQADNVAMESGKIKQGLLTYALVRAGLELGRADFKPADQTITLTEWLTYGREQTPKLYDILRKPDAEGLLVIEGLRDLEQSGAPGQSQLARPGNPHTQRPALFDFAKKRRDVVLRGK